MFTQNVFNFICCNSFYTTGNAFHELAAHPNLSVEDQVRNVITVFDKVETIGNEVFRWDEEYRLGRAAARTISSITDPATIGHMLDRFSGNFLYEKGSRQNFLNMFRVIYLELLWTEQKNEQVAKHLRKLIQS